MKMMLELLNKPGWRWVIGLAAFAVLVTIMILIAKYLPDDALSFVDHLAKK